MYENKAVISPSITLKDIFGSNFILNPRAPFSNYGWLPGKGAPEQLDSSTSTIVSIAGGLPIICNKCAITNEAKSLLNRAQVAVAPFIHTYRTEQDYNELLHRLTKKGTRLVFNYRHPTKVVDADSYWIDPKLLAFLNNKANLGKLLPADHIPQRTIIPSGEIKKAANALIKLPLVIKAATKRPTAGGIDVVICKNTKDIEAAAQYFRDCQKVVLEEYIEIKQNYCVQFAKTIRGEIIYLGTAEQITSPSGHYLGNWIQKNHEPPKLILELGLLIMKQASNLGFFGIAGFDIITSRDNRVYAIDLNFRLNGSTPALLLRDNIFRMYNASVLLFRKWKATVKWNKFISICKDAIENGHLIPLAIYNPIFSPYQNSIPLLSGILMGSSKEEVLAKERLLAKQGIL